MTKRSDAAHPGSRSNASHLAEITKKAAWAGFSLLVLGAAGAFGAGYDPFRDALEDQYGASVFVRMTEANTVVRPNPKPHAPVSLFLVNNSVKRLSAALASQDFSLSAVRRGARVPRVFVASLPQDIGEIRDLHEKRSMFIRTILPMILGVNEQIAAERRYLLDVRHRILAGEKLSDADRRWMDAISDRYKVAAKNGGYNWVELLQRVDTVPASLAIAQSIVETGWGASAPARNLNALFGMIGGDGTDTAVLATFDSPYESVAAYVHNLNTYGAYADFRRERAALRAEGKSLDGQVLASTLLRYSELGAMYARHIQQVIERERLKPFDDAQLSMRHEQQS